MDSYIYPDERMRFSCITDVLETTDWDGIKVIDFARWLMGESDELIF